MIDKASEEQLKNSIDIVDIISNYIEIKKSGVNFKANCPFHGEKTPSFVVSPSKQIFHCFGCQITGDAIKFVREYEKLNYPESLEKIASIMNFSLVYREGNSDYTEIRGVLEKVQNWYKENLKSNEIAKNYLQKRGISSKSIEEFGIGYVGNSDELMQFLSNNFLPIPKAKDAGVVAQKDGNSGFYARLIQRVTFPIYSASNSIVGFGGRTLINHSAKYINSPQTKLFNKSQILYGYSKAKTNIYREKRIIICEGYLDVILFHQAGFNTAVATLGTALTGEHIPILKRGEPKVILAYDGDKAGVLAGLKASKLLSVHGFEGKVVLFPNGADPADMISSGKSKDVANLLESGQDLIPFVIDMSAKSYNLENPHQKEMAFEEIRGYLDKLTPIIRESYISYASTVLGVSISLFGRQVKIENRKLEISSTKDNLGVLNIIKTITENRELIKSLLSVVKPYLFGEYASLLNIAIEGEEKNSLLIGLSLDDNYKVLDEEQFKKELLDLLKFLYIKKYKSVITDSSIPFNRKHYLIRKIKTDIIPRLQKGELIAYNEFDFLKNS